jgi:hypothetical protein
MLGSGSDLTTNYSKSTHCSLVVAPPKEQKSLKHLSGNGVPKYENGHNDRDILSQVDRSSVAS